MGRIKAKDVKLKSEIQFTQFVNPAKPNDVVSNKNFVLGDWNEIAKLETTFPGVTKKVIPIDFRDFPMLVYTTVEPGIEVPRHTHAEGIARFIISGSLKLNGVSYAAGDWILVPEGKSYEIQTEDGYSALVAYLQACETDEEK